jgi:hypothetical protein
MDTTTPIPFSQAVPKTPQEPDRHEIKDEMLITITDVLISTQTRYDKLAKINGLVNGTPTKWVTTSKTIVKHCEEILTNVGLSDNRLKTPVIARIYWRTSAKGQKYLDME